MILKLCPRCFTKYTGRMFRSCTTRKTWDTLNDSNFVHLHSPDPVHTHKFQPIYKGMQCWPLQCTWIGIVRRVYKTNIWGSNYVFSPTVTTQHSFSYLILNPFWSIEIIDNKNAQTQRLLENAGASSVYSIIRHHLKQTWPYTHISAFAFVLISLLLPNVVQ